MKTLNWRHTGWNARNFLFTIGQEITGQLTFNSFWNFHAVYTDKETNLKFSQKGFWDRGVLITKDGKTLGEIDFGLFGKQTLKLVTGERFNLSTSFWEQETLWKNEKGDIIVKYQQATMSSLGKGLISLNETLTIETEKLLVSGGLFIRKVMQKRRSLIVVIVILLSGASRHLS
jgi:hypothetical protein